MSDIDLSEAVEAAKEWTDPDIGITVSRYGVSINDAYEGIIRAALPHILAQIPEYIPPTSPKPGTRWEYGIMRDEGTPKPSRAAAEREIERQRKAPRSYRITNQRLVRRLVSDWEDVK